MIRKFITEPLAGQNGITIIAVILAMLFVGSMGLVVSNITVNKQIAGARSLNLNQAFYNAQAGVDWAIQFLIDDPSVTDVSGAEALFLNVGSKDLGNGSFTIAYNSSDDLTVTGTSGDQIRKVKFTCLGATFVGSSEGGGLATCSPTGFGLLGTPGGKYEGAGCDPNCTDPIQGCVVCPDDLDPINFPNLSLPGEGSAPICDPPNPPITGDHRYTDLSVIGQNCNGTINGPAKIFVDTNFTIDDGSITLDTTGGKIEIIVTGEIVFRGLAKYITKGGNDADLFGRSHYTQENDGRLDIQNTASVQVTGTMNIKNNTFVNISSNSSLLLRGDTSVKIENNANVNSSTGESASDLLILSNGDITIENNTDMKAALYTDGGDIDVKNNVAINGAMVAAGEIEMSPNATDAFVPDSSAGSAVLADQGLCPSGSGGSFPPCPG